jgi:hypothetical protein
VIATDLFPYRPRLAQDASGAEVVNDEEVDMSEALKDMTYRLGHRRLRRLHRQGQARRCEKVVLTP